MFYFNQRSVDNLGIGLGTAGLKYSIPPSMIPHNINNSTPMMNYSNNWLTTTAAMDPNTIILDQQPSNINSVNSSPSISSSITPINQDPDNNRQRVLRRRKGVGNTPQEIYARVQLPYNYAESYHYLIDYVKRRMGRDELVRISRALVLFRPSYMSLMATLTEEDLIYMEKCVQRTLLEFEKLIGFSGTPTVVWRRTGEIALVGKEFFLLTQWTKESLLGKRTYIYEVRLYALLQ